MAIAQAAAERQCARARAVEMEARAKEAAALEKTSEAAAEIAKARLIVDEAPRLLVCFVHVRVCVCVWSFWQV